VGHFLKAARHAIISPRTAPVIDSVSPGTLAAQAGIKKGDRIAMVNNTPINFQSDFTDIKNALAGTALTITYYRNNQPATAQVPIPSGSPFGVMWKIDKDLYKKERYTPFQAVGRGISYTASRLQLYVAQFKLFRSKEVKAHEQMGGFISMGKMFAPEFVWHDFLMMTAFISVALAFMNFLPIPGLDGGYVIFLLFEMITGKQVSEKVMEYATTVGLVILLALMVYVNGLDILRLFHIK